MSMTSRSMVADIWLEELRDRLKHANTDKRRKIIEYTIRRLEQIVDEYETTIAQKDAIIASYEIDAKHHDLQNFLDWAEDNMPDEDEE